MVRPERRVVLAGASPVRVSAGAPGSRLQPSGEIRPRRAECRKPLKQRGANQRAATTSERCSLDILSAERRLGGPSRSCHGEGNRQHPRPERVLDFSGVSGGGTLGKSNAEQERPYLAAVENGAIQGVLPLFRIKSRLFGTSLVSVPFFSYGRSEERRVAK